MNETLEIQVIMGRNSNLRILDPHSSIDQEVSSLVSRITHLVSIDASVELVSTLVSRLTKSTFLYSFLDSVFMSLKIHVLSYQHASWYPKHILDLPNYKCFWSKDMTIHRKYDPNTNQCIKLNAIIWLSRCFFFFFLKPQLDSSLQGIFYEMKTSFYKGVGCSGLKL